VNDQSFKLKVVRHAKENNNCMISRKYNIPGPKICSWEKTTISVQVVPRKPYCVFTTACYEEKGNRSYMSIFLLGHGIQLFVLKFSHFEGDCFVSGIML